jgi:hypothetical protein
MMLTISSARLAWDPWDLIRWLPTSRMQSAPEHLPPRSTPIHGLERTDNGPGWTARGKLRSASPGRLVQEAPDSKSPPTCRRPRFAPGADDFSTGRAGILPPGFALSIIHS